MPAKAKPVLLRFEAKIFKTEACWLWTSTIDAGTGYGHFGMKRADGEWRMRWAHRVSHELFKGPIPQGLVIDHLCRVRHCVNPDHLEPVTMRENILRGTSPSAKAAVRTECMNGHPYTTESVRMFRGTRQCKPCQLIWQTGNRRAKGLPLGNKFKTHCLKGHAFDERNTYMTKEGGRRCRRCRADWMMDHKALSPVAQGQEVGG